MDFSNGESKMDERMKELKAFDDTKLGVKGLVDAGIVNIPKMFVRPEQELAEELDHPKSHKRIPIIDLGGLLDNNHRGKIVDEVRMASEVWGFFQVVNHGIPVGLMGDMLEGIRKFNEEDFDDKKEFYACDHAKKLYLNSNHDLFQSKTVGWRDTLVISMLNSDVEPGEVPRACRDVTIEFINHLTELGNKLFGLLSEALCLKPDHLRFIQCNEGRALACHYYPKCPEPGLAIGITKHSDSSFLTLVAQDQTGGLEVLDQNKNWVDVEPIPGAVVVNIGDYLQIVSNDKFKSNVHRVLPSRAPRVSTAFFFGGRFAPPARLYGPIKELTSEESPPKYKDFLVSEIVAKFFSKGLHDSSIMDEYRL